MFDMDNMQVVLAFASTLSVMIFALVQLVKNSVTIPKNLVPAVGLIIGLLIGVVAYPFTELNLTMRLWSGGLAGLSATGLFELVLSKRLGKTNK